MSAQKRTRSNIIINNKKEIKLTIDISYGARKHDGEFYYCVNRGSTSETVHQKSMKLTLSIEKFSYFDLVPILTESLTKLAIPATFNSNTHIVMIPEPNKIALDTNKSTKMYHRLICMDSRKWSLSTDGALTVCIVDKVILIVE